MKTITIITPSNIEVEYKLAGAGARLAALIIDMLLQFFAILVCAGLVFGVNHQLYLAGAATQGTVVIAIFIILVFIIYFGYFILFEMIMNGQTLGKRLFGLRTIRDNGQPVEFSHVLMRGIIRSVLDIMYVGLFVILFSKKSKRLGDIAAGTIVVIENYDDVIISIQDWTLPEFIPPLIEMTIEERKIVEAWLRRRKVFPDNGAAIETKLAKYFADKIKKDIPETPPYTNLS